MALGVYKPRNPRNTRLWRILHRYFNAFQDAYEKRYGYIRRIVVKRVHAYLKCGILDFGFARVRCPKCRHEYLVAFSCKARGICPSCQAKRQAEFSAFISRDVLHQVPHRQVVLSVPRRLRPYFLHNRRLLAKLARCGYDTVRDLLTSAFKGKSSPGAIVCIQTFGSLLDFHPHLHILVSWGLFHGNGCFHPLHAVPSADSLSRLFRHKVLRMLLKQGAIDQDIVDNMLSWRHIGFGADIGAELQPGKGV